MLLTKPLKSILVIFVAGLAAQFAAVQAAAAPENSAQYQLGAGDQVKIWALGLEEFYTDKPYRIAPNGDLDLPLAGTIHAAGLTIEELRSVLLGKFAKEVLKPQVSIEIVEFRSQPVSVMGAVNHPGVHQLQGHKSLAEVISLADGIKDTAGPKVTISRHIENGPIPLLNAKSDSSGKYSVAEVDLKGLLSGSEPAENILVYPNDVVTVPTAESIFVIGEVHKPGEISMREVDSVTVLQALSKAEGFGPTPAPQNSKIIRIVPTTKERKEIPVDLRKVLAGKAEDVSLRANDILVVPSSKTTKIAVRALEAAVQTATGLVIWRLP